MSTIKASATAFLPACILALLLFLLWEPVLAHASETVENTAGTGEISQQEEAALPYPNNLKLSILGDSISTFTGTMPGDYNIYYPESGDIDTVEWTWWHQVLINTGMELCSNASSSNTNVTGNSIAMDGSAAGCSIRRIVDLKGADGSSPDVILVYMGINDFSRSREVGEFKAPSQRNEGIIMTFTDAYELMLQKILTLYPDARIYCCTLLERSCFDGSTGTPAVNENGNTVEDYNVQIKAIARAYGARVIDLYHFGITNVNLDQFTSEGLHPNKAGASMIAYCVTQNLIRP